MLTTTDPLWVVPFVYERLNRIPPDPGFTQAIGFVEGTSLVAGITYYNYNDFDLEVAVAVLPGFQWSRKSLRCGFSYPFKQLKVNRITARIEQNNFCALRFVERLGFVLEARLKQACKAGDLLLFRMLAQECRWIGSRSG
jgi:RimJ/RimL family protein N-acetyltransferase